jgi:multidrug efflux system membrane fusion protein
VQIGKATLQTLPITQNTIGAVQSLRSVTVKSQVDGVIAAVNFREGDEVQAGDLLISLDRRPFENNLRSARADLANARARPHMPRRKPSATSGSTSSRPFRRSSWPSC